MALINDVTAKCSSCGNETVVHTYGSINISENPQLKAQVKDGSLFVWECSHCGTLNLARYQTLYHDPKQKLMIWLMPDGALPADQLEVVENHMKTISESLSGSDEMEGYTLRRVSDVGSLIEKVNICDAGLEDTVIEMCKYVTKMEMGQKESDRKKVEEIMDAAWRFYKMSGPDNEITLSFPQDGQMKGLNIGFNVYEDCKGILQRNPSVKPDPGFAKIDAAWLARFFR